MHTSETSAGSRELNPPSVGSAARPFATPFSPWCSSAGKRAFDLVIASSIVLVTWPVMVVVAVAVWLSSRGPVLFRQERVGKNGRLFELMKFRSMRVAAERCGLGITRENDPRVLPLGRLLRRWKLDELPQLFNVLRGDMSLVGPRPDLPEFCARLEGDHRLVLDLTPGITGAASLVYRHEEQILAERDRDGICDYYVNHIYPDKIRIDLDYARNASLGTDLRILFRTFGAIFA